jgi:hypothetical protein
MEDFNQFKRKPDNMSVPELYEYTREKNTLKIRNFLSGPKR